MSEWGLRLRAILDRQEELVVVGLVVLGLIGGWLVYGAYITPDETTEERVEATWELEAESSHSARVVDGGEVFENGTVLRNRSIYYTSVSPVLNGTSRVGFQGDSGTLTVDAAATLVIEGVSGGDTATTLWRVEEALADETQELSSGESLVLRFDVNVSALANRTERIRESLGDGGEIVTKVETRADVSGTVAQRAVDRNVSWALLIGPEGGTYSVTEQGSPGDTVRYTTPVVVTTPPGVLGTVAGPLFVAVGLLGLVGVAVARARGWSGLSERERAWLAYRDDRSDFDEWITTMRLPPEAHELPTAEAGSLGDLVDFAIDTGSGVIEAPDGGVFSVVHDGYRHVYEAPSEPTAVDTDRLETGHAPTGGEGSPSEHDGGDRTADEAAGPAPDRTEADGVEETEE